MIGPGPHQLLDTLLVIRSRDDLKVFVHIPSGKGQVNVVRLVGQGRYKGTGRFDPSLPESVIVSGLTLNKQKAVPVK